ncbi:MAG: class I SAM-dependent RNA methyltransferase [Saprospiraceae bacterium]|nr:class I SAM-dependent RNA methyltransferase [Saprospiraceae bacterium]MCB0678067.1 class I SAM-dependent RNA methyltransferase [Saprospiraceae bacterium]
MKLLAKTFFGLEPALAAEWEALGAKEIVVLKRAVLAEGDTELLYRSNLELRTALRILTPLAEFECPQESDFYQAVYDFPWEQYLHVDGTLAVDAVSNSELFRHSKFLALRTKDAIVDRFRDRLGRRPNVDTDWPDLRINVHVRDRVCTLSLDSSGRSLHKRGYRASQVAAPINEVLAAGMLMEAGYPDDRPLFDPMCGSGTILTEAALMASSSAPQLGNLNFGFQRWPDFEAGLWDRLVGEARERVHPLRQPIRGADRDGRALRSAAQNLRRCGFGAEVQLDRADFFRQQPPFDGGLLVMNPPYDERLGIKDIQGFYREIGATFKHRYAGYSAWIISSNFEALQAIGLRPGKKLTLFNGALECRYLQFELYAGSKKPSKS